MRGTLYGKKNVSAQCTATEEDDGFSCQNENARRKKGVECPQKKRSQETLRVTHVIVNKDLRYTFSFSERLHLQKDFKKTLTSGRKIAHPALFLYVWSRKDGSPLRRLGLITSGTLGTAVKRNRLKRRLRELFRLNKHRLAPGIDVIFMPRKPAISLDFAELEKVALSLFSKAGAL